MAAFDLEATSALNNYHLAMPKLYKLALVLTANEQLARSLVRGTFRFSRASHANYTFDEKNIANLMRHMYSLWASKLIEDPTIQQRNPPEHKIFLNIPVKGSAGGNSHFAKFIANMPSQQRAALYLIYGEGASYDEAAEILSITVMAAMKILARGHASFANWFDHRGIKNHASPVGRDVAQTAVEKAA